MRKIGKIILWAFALFGGLIATVLFAVIAFTASVRDSVPDLPDQAILYLDLNEPLVERVATQPLFEAGPSVTVLEAIEAIRTAADTDQVKALAIGVGGSPISFAQAQELADAITYFRASGKPSFTYSDDLSSFGDALPELMVATAAETVWINPTGMVGLTGLALEVPYAADGLNEFGIEAEFEQRFEYKGGADPFTKSRMPLPVRRSLNDLASGLVDEAVQTIGRGRDLPEAQVINLMDRGLYQAREALSAGLVDVLDYEDAFDSAVEDTVGVDATWVDAQLVLAAAAELADENRAPEAPAPLEIAVVYGIGAIGVNDSGGPFADPGFDVRSVLDTLDAIADDGTYDAVLFRVASPGGAYGPSDLVWRAVHKVREAGIPVVVSMADTAASGGYFVSAAADRIVASPSTITGSIGVYGGKFNTQELWEDLGVRWESVSVGENAGMFSNTRAFDPGERRLFAESIDFVYEDFTTKVGTDRSLDATALDEAARGRIFTGRQALEAGLVDRLGGFEAAISEIMTLLDRPANGEYRLTVLPAPKEAWEAIAEAFEEGGFQLALERAVEAAIVRRVDAYTHGVLGDAALVLQPRGVVSIPPFVLRP